jgi:hypothetical protein
MLEKRVAVGAYFSDHDPNNTLQLSVEQWAAMEQICVVLAPAVEIMRLIQGGENSFLSRQVFLMTELLAVLEAEDYAATKVSWRRGGSLRFKKNDLQPHVRDVIDLLIADLKCRGLCEAKGGLQLSAIGLDPRLKDKVSSMWNFICNLIKMLFPPALINFVVLDSQKSTKNVPRNPISCCMLSLMNAIRPTS